MRTNSFIAEDIDGVWREAGRMQEKGVYMLNITTLFIMLDGET